MDSNTYLDLSARTVAKTFHGKQVSPYFLDATLAERLKINAKIDSIKKALFYGKERDNIPQNFSYSDHPYEPDAVVLHALLGIDSEAAELMELLVDDNLTREKVIDETGDLLWYVALLLREHGLTFEEVMEKNIAKLKQRYPQGFSTEAALNRNEALESAAIL